MYWIFSDGSGDRRQEIKKGGEKKSICKEQSFKNDRNDQFALSSVGIVKSVLLCRTVLRCLFVRDLKFLGESENMKCVLSAQF